MRRIIWGLLLFIVPVACFAQGKEKRPAPKPADGRPEYSSLQGVRDPEPTTRWRGSRLVRRSVKETKGLPKLKTEEEWALSEDGQMLTRTVLNFGMGRDLKAKYVFKRLPKA